MAFQLIVLDELHRRALRRDRIIRDRLNPLEKYNEEEIYRKYRFPRHEILRLTDLIANDLNKTNKNHAVPPVLQMCTALRFYATGVIHNVSGDMSGMGIKLLLYGLTALVTASHAFRLVSLVIVFVSGDCSVSAWILKLSTKAIFSPSVKAGRRVFFGFLDGASAMLPVDLFTVT